MPEKTGVKNDRQAYLMEAAGTAGFVILAGLMTIWFEHPSLPVMRSGLAQQPVLRRMMLGLMLGIYIVIVTLLAGKKSGAHLNPSVTCSFLSLGKMDLCTAVMYVLMQFAGAACGALLLTLLTGDLFSHPVINYAISEPRPPHSMLSAFVAEFVISFLMMFSLLCTASSRRYEKWVPFVAGGCIALFITVEVPFSGMSLNPARSFAASLVANKWKHLWVYCTAPVAAMLLAAEIFVYWKKGSHLFFKKAAVGSEEGGGKDYQEIPNYPLRASAK